MSEKVTPKSEATKSKLEASLAAAQPLAKDTSVEELKAKASSVLENSKTGIPTSAELSKVGYYVGLGSLVFGFPANLVAIVAGVAVEDRHRLLSNGSFKKIAEKKVLPTAEELKRSRIGFAAGALSLTAGVLASIVAARKK
jgi:hypothetical protein